MPAPSRAVVAVEGDVASLPTRPAAMAQGVPARSVADVPPRPALRVTKAQGAAAPSGIPSLPLAYGGSARTLVAVPAAAAPSARRTAHVPASLEGDVWVPPVVESVAVAMASPARTPKYPALIARPAEAWIGSAAPTTRVDGAVRAATVVGPDVGQASLATGAAALPSPASLAGRATALARTPDTLLGPFTVPLVRWDAVAALPLPAEGPGVAPAASVRFGEALPVARVDTARDLVSLDIPQGDVVAAVALSPGAALGRPASTSRAKDGRPVAARLLSALEGAVPPAVPGTLPWTWAPCVGAVARPLLAQQDGRCS